MVVEINSVISDHNFNIQKTEYESSKKLEQMSLSQPDKINPAKKYALAEQSIDLLLDAISGVSEFGEKIPNQYELSKMTQNKNSQSKILAPIASDVVEKIIKIVQTFEPPGIASRNIQECLIAQLEAKHNKTSSEKLALLILTESFDDFSKKHFHTIQKKYALTEDEIKDVFDEIKRLNPKPGGDDYISQFNTVIPDFLVKYDASLDDFIITLNDTTIPDIKVSSTYEKLVSASKNNKQYNKQTRE
jgi:DNA-directed RNA polymerase specialized sigma54-like protein